MSARACSCGCSRLVTNRDYFEGACRQRVYRTKLASAAGLPAGASLSLETLRTSKRTGLPSRDARALSPERRARRESKPTRPRRPDDRITIPTNEIEAYLAGNRDALEELLPPSARPSPRKSTVAVSVERTAEPHRPAWVAKLERLEARATFCAERALAAARSRAPRRAELTS